jgi:hypothetical protein
LTKREEYEKKKEGRKTFDGASTHMSIPKKKREI